MEGPAHHDQVWVPRVQVMVWLAPLIVILTGEPDVARSCPGVAVAVIVRCRGQHGHVGAETVTVPVELAKVTVVPPCPRPCPMEGPAPPRPGLGPAGPGDGLVGPLIVILTGEPDVAA